MTRQSSILETAIREKAVSVVQVPQPFRIPENILKKIRDSKQLEAGFDATQIIRLADAPAFLTLELNTELGFTTAKLLKIAKALDPRIAIDIEGEIFLDRKMLRNRFQQYLKDEQKSNVLRMSRSSRSAFRRNIILRELLEDFEQLLKNDTERRVRLTQSINGVLGDSYKALAGEDVLAFLESYRLNAEKRRIRAEEAE